MPLEWHLSVFLAISVCIVGIEGLPVELSYLLRGKFGGYQRMFLLYQVQVTCSILVFFNDNILRCFGVGRFKQQTRCVCMSAVWSLIGSVLGKLKASGIHSLI